MRLILMCLLVVSCDIPPLNAASNLLYSCEAPCSHHGFANEHVVKVIVTGKPGISAKYECICNEDK